MSLGYTTFCQIYHTSSLPAGLGAPKAKGWFPGPRQVHGIYETGTAHQTPHVACYNGSDGCVSATLGIATPYFPAPAGHGDIFHISNVAMASRSFIFSNFYLVGPGIMEHQHRGFSTDRQTDSHRRERTLKNYYVTYRHQLKLRLWRDYKTHCTFHVEFFLTNRATRGLRNQI